MAAKTYYAWCWRSGLIQIGATPPMPDKDGSGPIIVARGRMSALVRVLDIVATRADVTPPAWIVRSVADAFITEKDAIGPLCAWVDWCADGSGSKAPSGVEFGRHIHKEVTQ